MADGKRSGNKQRAGLHYSALVLNGVSARAEDGCTLKLEGPVATRPPKHIKRNFRNDIWQVLLSGVTKMYTGNQTHDLAIASTKETDLWLLQG